MYAQIIVDISHSNIDKVFEYAVPEQLEKKVKPGSHVAAPFGRGDKEIEGFVLQTGDICTYPQHKTKRLSRVLEDDTVLLPDQIALAYRIKELYCCNLVDALRLMIPAQMRGEGVHEKSVRTVSLAEGVDVETAKSALSRAKLQLETFEFISTVEGELAVSEIAMHIAGAQAAITALNKKGLVTLHQRGVYRKPYKKIGQGQNVRHTLTGEQQLAADAVTAALDKSEYKGFLLHGVTGSGKTEVYMRCVDVCLALERDAIMLVPEISLTPQTVDRFRRHFGDNVAVLHSGLSSGERFDEWRRIRMGEVHVVVGARSAVFAPVGRLGLVVIDEEHETSYFSERTPRYDAYTMAKLRCEACGAPLLLGTATPSVETYYKAQMGELELLRLKERVCGRPMPKVALIDMRLELAQGNRSIFSVPLYREMKRCLEAKKQLILFLNRRGFSSFISCRSCGHVMECPNCAVSLTYHKDGEHLVCHYCGHTEELPEKCPECGKPHLKLFGAGTQQVEEVVHKYFPDMRTLRMDHDTTQTKDAHVKLLELFSSGQADVLIGTQMIAKGLDFPNVVLVGCVAADSALYVPDFRSAERAFQLITQVAGRAGRDSVPGRVIVQTYSPEHPSLVFASRHDFEGFYGYEIAEREKNLFPPFADFVRFLFEADKCQDACETSEQFKAELAGVIELKLAQNGLDKSALCYISSMPAPIALLKGKFRYQVILKLLRNDAGGVIMEAIREYTRKARQAGVATQMEVNPQSMM